MLLLESLVIKRDKVGRERTNYYGKAEKEVRKVGMDDGEKKSQRS